MKDVKTSQLIIVLVILKLVAIDGVSQGCSDAGFCSIGNLQTSEAQDSLKGNQKLSFVNSVGIGDESVLVITPAIQYDNQISEDWSVQAKITGNYADGNLGTAVGFGDLFLSGTRTFSRKRSWKTSVTAGIKIPLNKGNHKQDRKSLPMQYQSSLGTMDIITGLTIANSSWQFSLGWQQPVSGSNGNEFLVGDWPVTEAEKYSSSNEFNRRGDVLLRLAYLFTVKQNFSFTTGVLGIYHLGEDTYKDESVSNNPIAIEGSQGPTINMTLSGFWKVNARVSLGFSAGAPIVFRDVRPDGLTRSFVFAPEISWNF